MIPDEVTERGVGDNSGTMRELALSELRSELHFVAQPGGKTFAERKAEFMRSAAAAVVRDRDTAGDAADLVKLAGEVREMIEAKRLERSNPFRDTANALKGVADDFWREVGDAMKEVSCKIDEWDRDEKKRILDQRIEQQRMEDELTKASGVAPLLPTSAPIPARRAPIRGMLGATVSEVEVKTYEIEDFKLIPEYILGSETVNRAILEVARTMSKHMGAIPGIRVNSAPINRIK